MTAPHFGRNRKQEQGRRMNTATTNNIMDLKYYNQGKVIKSVSLGTACTRPALTSELGLSKMAISKIVTELIDDSIIREEETLQEEGERAKRKAKDLKVNDWVISAIAIHITRHAISSMLIDINGNTDLYCQVPYSEDATNELVIRIIEQSVDRLLECRPEGCVIYGIGIASIGPIDIGQGIILDPPNFGEVNNLKIVETLSGKYHYPVYLDNDMNCGALAELFYGHGKGNRDLVFLGFNHGVGAGIIVNGELLHGADGHAGEIGHVSINPFGEQCACGQKGCVELYVKGDNLLKNTQTGSYEDLNEILSDPNHVPARVRYVMDEYQTAMRTLLVMVANIYDPNVIVIGDSDRGIVRRYMADFYSYMNTHMLNHGYKQIDLVYSDLDHPFLSGAGGIVFQKIMNGETPVFTSMN